MTTTTPRWPALKLAILTHYFYSTRPFESAARSVDKYTQELKDAGFLHNFKDGELDTTSMGDEVVTRVCKAAAAIADRVTAQKPEPVAPKPTTFKFNMASGKPWPIPPADSERRYIMAGTIGGRLRAKSKSHAQTAAEALHDHVTAEAISRAMYGTPFRPVAPEELYSGTMRDYQRQARERLEHHRQEVRKQEERERQQRSWNRRFDHFKRLGTELHEAGRVSRSEWKQLFDIAFARCDKLNNAPFAFEIYKALREFRRGRAVKPGGFREMRRAIFAVEDPANESV